MEEIRKINNKEVEIIKYLANKANYSIVSNIEQYLACPLTGEEYGSVILASEASLLRESIKKREISNCMFYDIDNSPVAMYLLVSENDDIYELDIWKCNGCKICHIPSLDSMQDIPTL